MKSTSPLRGSSVCVPHDTVPFRAADQKRVIDDGDGTGEVQSVEIGGFGLKWFEGGKRRAESVERIEKEERINPGPKLIFPLFRGQIQS